MVSVPCYWETSYDDRGFVPGVNPLHSLQYKDYVKDFRFRK